MQLEYNTTQPKIIFSEYGRHVQSMATHLLSIKERRERTRAAETVIQTMAQVQPNSKDTEEWRQKLWDHLHIMTDFKLDVDSTYPKPLPEKLEARPEKMNYPSTDIRYKHYGKIVEEMVKKASMINTASEREALTEAIACLMKKAYMTWNKTTVDDNTIVKDLKEMSYGKLILKDTSCLSSVYVSLNQPVNKPQNFQRRNNKNKMDNRNRKKGKNKNRNGGF